MNIGNEAFPEKAFTQGYKSVTTKNTYELPAANI